MMYGTSIFDSVSSIPMLNGSNFKEWKESMMLVLGCMDLDYALRVEHPDPVTETSSTHEKQNFEKWDRSNRLSLMIIKHRIPETFRGGANLEEITKASDCLAKIEKLFARSNEAEIVTLLSDLISMKYDGIGNVREHIMQMSFIASKLRELKFEVYEGLLIRFVLRSLPMEFGQIEVRYNCLREKWTLNELISICVHEEERMMRERTKASMRTCKGKRKHEFK